MQKSLKWVAAAISILPLFLLSGCGQKTSVVFTSDTAAESEIAASANEQKKEENDLTAVSEKAETEPLAYAYICGAVRLPGVYQLSSDMRLFELVEKAGGFTEDADQEWINLASRVQDGEQICILTKEETDGQEKMQPERQDGTEGKININTADRNLLMTLPGIGEAKADAIIRYRTDHGMFEQIEDIQNISGIKSAVYTKIKDLITV